MKTVDEIVQELLPGYVAARRQEVPKMLELLAQHDFEALRVLSHSLKGSGGSFGLPELTRFGGALERSAQQSDTVSFGADLAQLQEYLEHLECSPKALSHDRVSGPVKE